MKLYIKGATTVALTVLKHVIHPYYMPQALPYVCFTVQCIGSWTQAMPGKKSCQKKSYLPEEMERRLPVDSCRRSFKTGGGTGGKDQER